MKLYHGSNTSGIKMLTPRLADHGKPYLYLTENEVVALFYTCNAVERPHYLFPYGFDKMGTPVYHEIYSGALWDAANGRTGYLYEVEATKEALLAFDKIPGAYLSEKPLDVCRCTEIPDAYRQFCAYEQEGKLIIERYEEQTQKQRDFWDAMMVDSLLSEKQLPTDGSYARFFQEKLPQVWAAYLKKAEAI